MIWVVVWAVGVVAFLWFIFRGHLRWLLFWIAMLAVVIASAFLQQALIDDERYGYLLARTSHIGRGVVIFAVTVLVTDIAALVLFTIRHGHSDNRAGKVITANSPLRSMSPGAPPSWGWSKRKILVSKNQFVTMESLVDGTATLSERTLVAGIYTLFISFFLIFVGVGLILMQGLLIFALFPVIPGIWLYKILRHNWQEYQKARSTKKP